MCTLLLTCYTFSCLRIVSFRNVVDTQDPVWASKYGQSRCNATKWVAKERDTRMGYFHVLVAQRERGHDPS